jgi:hypothetical protein
VCVSDQEVRKQNPKAIRVTYREGRRERKGDRSARRPKDRSSVLTRPLLGLNCSPSSLLGFLRVLRVHRGEKSGPRTGFGVLDRPLDGGPDRREPGPVPAIVERMSSF